jgi:NifU-like protein involved in Fe-S cluster formation
MELYSRAVVDHFVKPRLTEALERVDGQGDADSIDPECPDKVHMYVQLDGETLAGVRQETQGCVATVAAASFLAERVVGATLDEARAVTEATLRQALGGVPARHVHCLDVPINALAAALDAASAADDAT